MRKELKKVERTAETAAFALGYRDDAIRQAREAGISLRDIAVAAGLSHETVRRICEGR